MHAALCRFVYCTAFQMQLWFLVMGRLLLVRGELSSCKRWLGGDATGIGACDIVHMASESERGYADVIQVRQESQILVP
jgi:hypothetical protein